jgi:GNAT superfamily N-acetyltransferase
MDALMSTTMTSSITIRPLAAGDSIEALTTLLHKAYASLGAQGWNFTAVDQSVELTAKRVAGGGCLVAEAAGQLVGTVNMRGPYRPEQDAWSLVTPWYLREDTAILSQFAVDPALQGQGLGERLMDAAEAWAAERGFAHVALDTAKPAEHLQRRYAKRGYVHVGETQWDGKTYASVLMVKTLGETV